MQTFKLTLQIDTTAVIPQQFLDEARKEAQKPDASLFLRTMQEKFPEDDDQFMLAVVKNALRTTLRVQTHTFLLRSGVGGSVSPVQIVSETVKAGKAAVAAFAEASEGGAIPARESKAEQLRIGKDTPGALVQGLVEDRAE